MIELIGIYHAFDKRESVVPSHCWLKVSVIPAGGVAEFARHEFDSKGWVRGAQVTRMNRFDYEVPGTRPGDLYFSGDQRTA